MARRKPKLFVTLGNRFAHACPRCRAPLQMATGFSFTAPRPLVPREGDFSHCAECRGWNRFVEEGGRLVLKPCAREDALGQMDPRERRAAEVAAEYFDSKRGRKPD